MAWFNQFLYDMGSELPVIGTALDAIQAEREKEYLNKYRTAPDLAAFSAIPNPDDIYDSKRLASIMAAKDKYEGKIQQQDAAPVAKMLSDFAASGNDADPNFTGKEWIEGMATSPTFSNRAISPTVDPATGRPKLESFGVDPATGKEYFAPARPTFEQTMVKPAPMTQEQFDAGLTGSIPAAKKGNLPLSSFAANPVTAALLQKATADAQNKGTLARVFEQGANATPMDLATLAMDKNTSGQFENVTQGSDRVFKQTESKLDTAAQAALNNYIANTPLTRDVESWNKFAEGMRKIPNIDPKLVDATLKDIQSRNAGAPAGTPLSLFAKSGNATTAGNVQVDMFGNPIADTKTTATNHAPQGGGDADPKQVSKDFQNDLTYLRSLERTVANGGKGVIMVDGVPTSFDGTAESLAELTRLRDDHKDNMYNVYPTHMAKRYPKKSEKKIEGNLQQIPIDVNGKPKGQMFTDPQTKKNYIKDSLGNIHEM